MQFMLRLNCDGNISFYGSYKSLFFSLFFFNKLKKFKYLKLELNACSEIGGGGSSFIELSSGSGI